MLVDHDMLVDCGTGVGDLSIAELAQIDHVFITHAHLDHIACLPLLIDTVGDMRKKPLIVHATEATLDVLRKHIFNWAIWPDFSEIPSKEAPFLRFEPVRVGECIELNGRRITPLPANHTVPAVGYWLDSGVASLALSGDTGPCPEFWQAVNAIENLKYLVIETAFPNREKQLAQASLHLCPHMLATELGNLHRYAEIFITHLKPGQSELTMREILAAIHEFRPQMLQHNQVLTF